MGPRHLAFVILAILLVLPAAAFAGKTASCTFDTFSVPSGYSLEAVEGIGDDGTVVGQVTNNDTLVSSGFLRSPQGTLTIYNAPHSSVTWLYGQNATGSSTGTYIDNGSKPALHGFFLVGGTFTAVNYPKAASTWLFDVNQLGAAVGSYSGGNTVQGFMLVNGKYTSITYPNAAATYPMAVNDNGAVVGSYGNGEISNGFLWQNGKFTTINYGKPPFGTALSGINNDGVIVGNRLLSDGSGGFIYKNGVLEKIVYTGARYTIAGGINNNGVIAGMVVMSPVTSLGFTAVCK